MCQFCRRPLALESRMRYLEPEILNSESEILNLEFWILVSPLPCHSRLIPRLRPKFRGSSNRNDFEINQVGPAANPRLQQFRAGCLHDLKAAGSTGFHPACVVGDAVGKHAAILLKPCSDRRLTARLESFDDHKEHGRSLYQPGLWGNRRAKAVTRHRDLAIYTERRARPPALRLVPSARVQSARDRSARGQSPHVRRGRVLHLGISAARLAGKVAE